MIHTPRLLLVLGMWLSIVPAASATDADRLPLGRIQAICYPADREDEYGRLAYGLRAYLQAAFGVQATIQKQSPQPGEVAIVLGRELAQAGGWVSADELNAVRVDGFVIRITDDGVALAGFGPQGTHYAVWRMFRMAGAFVIPGHTYWREESSDGSLPIGTVATKPFFEFRDCRGDLDQGAFGTTLRQFSLGSAKDAANAEKLQYDGWLGWDHTAGYLVPTSLYAQSHPEFYAQQADGSRTPGKSASTVTLCTSNPHVRAIMVERAMQWMSQQSPRQFFAVTEGDATPCVCAQCRAADHHPYYTTDRMMSWVNHIARQAAVQHPDKTLLTFAYIRDVKPPVTVKPEPNVAVLYAPWVWTSRSTSAVDWAHPLNTTTMEEFLAWTACAPGQIGVYDYVYGNWMQATAARIKFWARHNVRWAYLNAPPRDPLFVWVCANLLWDPFQDVATLQSQFIDGYYGPAAKPMAAYHALREQTIERDIIHDMLTWGTSPAYLSQAAEWLDAAERAIAQGDERAQKRVKEVIEAARQELARRGAAAVTEDLPPRQIELMFDAANESDHWLTDGSEAIFQPADVSHGGVRVRLPMSGLPVVPNSMGTPVYAGMLYAERQFDPPVDVSQCWYAEFHLRSTAAMRCTVQIHGATREFDLHPGEQIIRMDLRQFDANNHYDPATWDHQVSQVSFRFTPIHRDEAQDGQVVILGMRWSNQLPTIEHLPHMGKAVWLSQFRPNVMTPGLITGAEAANILYTTRGAPFTHPTGDRWKSHHGGRIKFRSYMPHAALTPIFAIEAQDGAEEAAMLLQRVLERLFHVRLPVRQSDDGRNCVTLSARPIGDDGGFAIDVRDGRVLISGDVKRGVIRYLEGYGVRVDARGWVAAEPLHPGHRGMLHELYVVEKPWFEARREPVGRATVSDEAIHHAALMIKQAARKGVKEAPADALVTASKSPRAAYVIDRLLWNPLVDTSRLLQEADSNFTE